MESHDAKDALGRLGGDLKEEFEVKKRVLSFAEYFELFWEAPHRHARNAARYLLDAFEHYGSHPVERPWGTETRWRLFDAPFDGGRNRLVGQEAAQAAIYKALRNFTRERRVARLILLHGPNGSAKSTIITCIARALVDYSKTDDGALYTFKWVFPTAKVGKKRFGFGVTGDGDDDVPADLATYAHLEDKQVDARLATELRDHPLLLLPKAKRQQLLDERLAACGQEEDFTPSDYVLHGDLSPRNREIFEALLASYQGDFNRVLAHVQVERFFVSRRYRHAMVTVEPQLQVDATIRQITADKSLENLPPSLRNVVLYEPMGDLVDANRGLVEYNDLLKRPIEAYKYLLSTCEKGTVALPNCILYLDVVLMGSTNEIQLTALKQHPEFQSFKGRFDLVRVPYLRSYHVEQEIYDAQVTEAAIHKHVAPHATLTASLWSVLTRLRRPDPDDHTTEVRDIIRRLTPMEKAGLYAEGRMPGHLAQERHGDLRRALSELYDERDATIDYEGVRGASPREIRTILLNAAQSDDYECLSPLGILTELERLVQDRSVYDFLQVDPEGPYHDHDQFIEEVRRFYLGLVDEEFRDAIGLVGEAQYTELFTRYITQVSHVFKKEKLYNPLTQTHEDPDESFMKEMERTFRITEPAKQFRQNIVGSVGAYRVEHPDEEVDYREIFPKLFRAMHDSFYEKQRATVFRTRQNVLTLLADDGDRELDEKERDGAQRCLDTLLERYGYCRACAHEALRFLHQVRYHEDQGGGAGESGGDEDEMADGEES